MTSYTWTVDSALYQLRWEPSERRASAVEYLREVILDNENESEQVIRDIAMTLLSLNTESDQENPPEPSQARSCLDVPEFHCHDGEHCNCPDCHDASRFSKFRDMSQNAGPDYPLHEHSALCSSNITGEDRCNCVQPEDRIT
jgi:hypothetical protein